MFTSSSNVYNPGYILHGVCMNSAPKYTYMVGRQLNTGVCSLPPKKKMNENLKEKFVLHEGVDWSDVKSNLLSC